MATLRIMYWKEIPVQVKSKEPEKEVSVQLGERFQQAVDAIAMFDGSINSDEYLESWQWGEEFHTTESAEHAANELASKFNDNMPADFVKRIRDMQRNGTRNPSPGAIDKWAGISKEE